MKPIPHIILSLFLAGFWASLGAMNNHGQLFSAARDGELEQVQQLLATGVDVNITDAGGYTPLIYAAIHGKTEVVAFLLKNGANIHKKSNTGTPLGNIALRTAATNGYTNIVKLLLRAGADARRFATMGKTPLELAVQHGHTKTARAIQHHLNMLRLTKQANQLIRDKKTGNKTSLDKNKIIGDLIKYYYRTKLLQFLNLDLIELHEHKEKILNKALTHNDIDMVKAIIASGYVIPTSILKKSMSSDLEAFLQHYLSTVQTLYGLRHIKNNLMALMPDELIAYLLASVALEKSELAIAQTSLV